MADIQMGYEIAQAEGLTVSSDGTTHKNINFEARHVHMPVATENPAVLVHKTRLVGVDSATDHSSQTQVTGWTSKIQEKLDVYNQSPLAQQSKSVLRLADFFVRLHGASGDHSKDQIKLAELLREMKQEFTEKSLGEERLLEMSIPEMLELLSKANSQKIAAVGGQLKWARLSEAERLKADAEMMSAVVLKLGHDAYVHLPNEEQDRIDLFVHSGCAMHKDLNCFKGGSAAMANWWKENSVDGPILLANKDNAAVLEKANDAEEYGAAEQRAHDASSGGGVKLASLAGMIFNNKDDKVGQQDTHKQFFASRGVKVNKFPGTSNNRYQSHALAAAELITHLTLYTEYMEWIKDGKDRPGFTNMEQNVYCGLQDIPTQTELVVLALYAQAVSHPYTCNARGPGAKQVNMLDLGPLHLQIQKHIEKVIETPHILLPPHASYKHGTADGKSWEDANVMEAISKLGPSLPHLEPLLVAFFKGALETWKRFTPEFQEGGIIDQLTPEEKEKAHRPPANDHNEGALGSLRLKLRFKPNMSMHQYNALAMFKSNDTAAFVQKMFVKEDHVYVHEEACKRDSGHLEQARQAAIIAFRNKKVADQRQKMAEKAEKQHTTQARLAAVQRVDAVEDVTINMTNDQLRDQLEIYRQLIDGIPGKSKLKIKAELIAALRAAITRYKALPDTQNSES